MVALFSSLALGLLMTALLIGYGQDAPSVKPVFLGAMLLSYLFFFWKLDRLAFSDASVPERKRRLARWLVGLLLGGTAAGAGVQIFLATG